MCEDLRVPDVQLVQDREFSWFSSFGLGLAWGLGLVVYFFGCLVRLLVDYFWESEVSYFFGLILQEIFLVLASVKLKTWERPMFGLSITLGLYF